ncbi:hypothetical protein V6N13_138479 [Hibiscus sabdariffa]
MARPWNVQLRHINRSKNKVADTLATLSQDRSLGEVVFERPPEEVMSDLQQDMVRTNVDDVIENIEQLATFVLVTGKVVQV